MADITKALSLRRERGDLLLATIRTGNRTTSGAPQHVAIAFDLYNRHNEHYHEQDDIPLSVADVMRKTYIGMREIFQGRVHESYYSASVALQPYEHQDAAIDSICKILTEKLGFGKVPDENLLDRRWGEAYTDEEKRERDAQQSRFQAEMYERLNEYRRELRASRAAEAFDHAAARPSEAVVAPSKLNNIVSRYSNG